MSTATSELQAPASDLRKRSAQVCKHCGSPLLDARAADSGFCCNGCSYVYRLINEQGLGGYYGIKDAVTSPADPAVFHPRETSWIEELQSEAEHSASTRSLSRNPNRSLPTPDSRERERLGERERSRGAIPEMTVSVQGISCAGCVWLIERVFRQQHGARDIVVSPHHGTMRLRWTAGEFSATEFARRLQSLGYLTGPAEKASVDSESRALVKRIGLCAAFAMNVMLYALPSYFGMEPSFEYARLFGILTAVFGTLSFLVGGTFFLGRAVRALREGAMHIDLPIAIGIAGAYAGSMFGWLAGIEGLVYFDFLSAFVVLMLVGRWAQIAATERNRRRLLSQQPAPRSLRLTDGREIAPSSLVAGDEFQLPSGQTLPVEGRLDGESALFSLASINGESEPRLIRTGQRVPAGAVNVGRETRLMTALQGWNESLLARLLEPGVREGTRHRLLENIVKGYLIGILGVATASGIWWWYSTGDIVQTWSVVTAVLVVSCPCAIGLAFPLADEIATVALRRKGVFVLDGDLWSRLGRVRSLVFDKTGTLTLETPVLLNPDAIRSLEPEARSALHALVRDNPHPISQCLLEHLLAEGGPSVSERENARTIPGGTFASVTLSPPPAEVCETIGQGVKIGTWSLGRPGWCTEVPAVCQLIADKSAGPPTDECRLSGDISFDSGGSEPADSSSEAPEEGHALRDTPAGATEGTVLAREGVVVAVFRFADSVRPDARLEMDALQKRGYPAYILSGDEQTKVRALAENLGLPESNAIGGMSPKGKAAWIDAHARDSLMLGDGANDSLAFERALCRGTPVIHRGVLERKSDFYYLGRGIAGVRALFEADTARRKTQISILGFSVVYNLAAVGLAVAGLMNPLVAAILMPVNSLLTIAIVTGGMRRLFRG